MAVDSGAIPLVSSWSAPPTSHKELLDLNAELIQVIYLYKTLLRGISPSIPTQRRLDLMNRPDCNIYG
jgi:hypothetical protein